MATRTRKSAIYLKAETSYGSEDTSGTSDGSGFTAVKCLSLDLLTDQTQMLDTAFATGRNRQSAPEVGPDGAQVSFSVPVQGLLTHAGDGTNASTIANDWFDMLLTNVFGAATTTQGEGIDAAATASSLVTDADTYTNQDMAAVQGASYNGGKVNWRRLTGTASPYTLDRDFAGGDLDGTEVSYGAKMYRPGTPGATLSACYDLDGTIYLLLGGRISSMSITMNAGELATVSITMDFDSKAVDATKTALPTIGTFAGTPVKGLLGAFAWGTTEYAAKSVVIDFGITAQPDSTVSTANGRSDIDVISTYPTVTVEPAFATTYETDLRAGTARILSIQLGSGVVSGGAMNACSMFMESARLTESNAADDGGRLRNSLTFQCVDAGIFTGSIIANYFQFSRG